jgi:hypothetical protein
MDSKMEVNDVADPSKVPCCKCKDESGMGIYSVVRVSKTEKNKDRSFFACPLGQSKGCGFFCWVEDVIVDVKTGLAKRKYIPPVEGQAKKPKQESSIEAQLLERIEALEKSYAAFQERLQKLEEQEPSFINLADNELLTPPTPKTQKTTGGTKKSVKPRLLP